MSCRLLSSSRAAVPSVVASKAGVALVVLLLLLSVLVLKGILIAPRAFGTGRREVGVAGWVVGHGSSGVWEVCSELGRGGSEQRTSSRGWLGSMLELASTCGSRA